MYIYFSILVECKVDFTFCNMLSFIFSIHCISPLSLKPWTKKVVLAVLLKCEGTQSTFNRMSFNNSGFFLFRLVYSLNLTSIPKGPGELGRISK